MELPPFILPNTGNMGLPICLFAYGSQGLGIAGAIAALIILFIYIRIIFGKQKFDIMHFKSPAFYAVIISV